MTDLDTTEKLEVERNHSAYWKERALAAERLGNELLARVLKLEAAIDDVVLGTPLDKHGNRDDDGMQFDWNINARSINKWLERLTQARGDV